jgi:hypothetical protein
VDNASPVVVWDCATAKAPPDWGNDEILVPDGAIDNH